MSHVIENTLIELTGNAPSDLVTYFAKGTHLQSDVTRINCLNFLDAMKYSKSLLSISIFNELGMIALDDSNNSDPYGYVTKGPCTGWIIFMSHDGDPEFRFPNLPSFLSAIKENHEASGDIEDIQRTPNLWIDIEQHIQSLLCREDDDSVSLLCLYIPVAEKLSHNLKQQLTNHPDFLIRESFAQRLLRNTTADDIPYLTTLAADKYGQVSRPAKTALSKHNRN